MNVDGLRGHDFYPPDEVLLAIPPMYATEDVPTAEKVMHLHYMVGSCDWWIAELDRDWRMAFGFVNLGDPQNAEWGNIDLEEMRTLLGRTPQGLVFVVERDLLWTPTLFGSIDIGEERW